MMYENKKYNPVMSGPIIFCIYWTAFMQQYFTKTKFLGVQNIFLTGLGLLDKI